MTTSTRPGRPLQTRVRQPHQRTVAIARYAVMVALAAFFAFPILYMFMSSFKSSDDLLRDATSVNAFLPSGRVSLDNYAGVFARVPAVRFIANSLFVTFATVLAGLVVNSLAGFALSRMRWRGRELVLSVVIATLIVPFETIAIPLLFVVSKLPWIGLGANGLELQAGWMNSYQVQILPFVANGFSIFLFVQYFKSLPVDLDEAAKVDGATWFQIYRRVIMPLSGPVIATVAILTFLPIWNAYLWPLMVTQTEDIRPAMVGLQYFFQLNTEWGQVMAYLSLITLPVLVFFLLLQRSFVESIAASGVKG